MAFFDRFKGGRKNEGAKPPKAKRPAAVSAKAGGEKAGKPAAPKVAPPKDSTAYRVLVHPIVSEKTARLEKGHQYVFAVAPGANKVEIKKAVEKHYRVRVTSVNVVNMRGKKVRYGRIEGQRKDRRKAYVTVREGQSITF